jgi:hypothetical protein
MVNDRHFCDTVFPKFASIYSALDPPFFSGVSSIVFGWSKIETSLVADVGPFLQGGISEASVFWFMISFD